MGQPVQDERNGIPAQSERMPHNRKALSPAIDNSRRPYLPYWGTESRALGKFPAALPGNGRRPGLR